MSELHTRDWYTDPTLIQDPFAYYEACRAQSPVFREPHRGAFMVTGYEETCAIYRDSETFSSCNSFTGPLTALPGSPYGDDVSALIEKHRRHFTGYESLVCEDPPLHTDHRGLMMRLLTPKRLEENEEFMRRLADRRIDGFVAQGGCEFLRDYAQPFAMLVIADLLGVPEEDHPKLRALFDEAGPPGAVGGELPSKPLGFLDGFFLDYVKDRREHPREDVLTQLACNTFADGGLPEPMESVNAATILFAGGQGTSARFLGNMLHFVAEHPEIQQRLREDRSLIPNFVEEMLRFNSPTKLNQRLARKTSELGGVEVPAGSALALLLPAANRDPRRFESPNEFRVDRSNAREHVAFGRGIHSCPGAPLVRADARATLERLLDRLGDIRLSPSKHGPPENRQLPYTHSYLLRGFDELHLEFDALH